MGDQMKAFIVVCTIVAALGGFAALIVAYQSFTMKDDNLGIGRALGNALIIVGFALLAFAGWGFYYLRD